MSASKHTPGPWEVCTNKAGHPAIRPIGRTGMNVPWVPDEHDACLIAAAPDLLDALKAIMQQGELACIPKGHDWGSSGKKPATMDAFAFPRHMLTDIEAAISKAEASK